MKNMIGKRGSSTAEVSIIFSVVFLLIAALVYAFIIIYQYAVIQSSANQAVNIGAYYYVNSVNSNLYWRIYEKNSLSKEEFLKNYIEEELDSSVFPSDRKISIKTSYRLLAQQLTVRIEERVPLPAGDLLSIFGIPSDIILKADASIPLDDNAEFIRNMDTVIDIKNCLLNSDNKWIGEGTKVNEIIKKLIKTN